MATTRTHTNHERRVVVLYNLRAILSEAERFPGAEGVPDMRRALHQLSREELVEMVMVMAVGTEWGRDAARVLSERLA